MSWQERLRQMVLAGGALVGGCSGSSCGNASSDPCICDRPSSSSAAAQACSEQTTCHKSGGVWQSGNGEWGLGGKCQRDSGTMSRDSATMSGDGSAKDAPSDAPRD